MKRLLSSSSALFWGLQAAFLNPVLALLLVSLFGATPLEVGWVLMVYNASGFIASLIVPAYADRHRNYLGPMLVCGILTFALVCALALTTSLPIVVIALVVLGGPAGVGSSLLFADLKHSGAGPRSVVNARAVVSFAWVAGPPLATIIMGALGNRSILPVLAVVAVFNVATALLTIARERRHPVSLTPRGSADDDHRQVPRRALIAIVAGFVALQATNNAAVAIMSLFVTDRLGLPLLWSGVALGVSALLEIPALLTIGRLVQRVSSFALIASGCIAGIVYYAAMALVTGPIALVALQVLNAWFFGVVAGIGLTLFQQIIRRPGVASGLFTNTRRVGAIISGPIIGLGATTAMGYQGVFVICAALTVVALVLVEFARRGARRTPDAAEPVEETAR
ncbi:MFS transporter [Parafrigoribacterium humi]|uniref:MFS transporter n=1 Tax=Parafrigoribacterium humi TaxID=3144664 RepID=UPI0032EE2D70